MFVPAFSTATTGVDQREAGVASAVANTAQQMGASLGTALLNTVAATATAAYLAAHALWVWHSVGRSHQDGTGAWLRNRRRLGSDSEGLYLVLEPVPGLGELAFGECEDLGWCHLEHERLAGLALKGAVGHVEAPIAVVLRLPCAGQAAELGLVGDSARRALDHNVES